MKKLAAVGLLAVAVIVLGAVPSEARRGGGFHGRHGGFHGHGPHARVFVGIGPAFWWGPPYPWWYYPPPYYVYSPPPVIVQEPPVYIEGPQASPSYWYYCPSAKAYYPTVQTCPETWIKVPPRAP
jgi:hypothetical protein